MVKYSSLVIISLIVLSVASIDLLFGQRNSLIHTLIYEDNSHFESNNRFVEGSNPFHYNDCVPIADSTEECSVTVDSSGTECHSCLVEVNDSMP